MQITKTDYLEYIFCKKNLWLKKHKPELFENVELSDFEKGLLAKGNLVEQYARKLFPDGVLIDTYGEEAVKVTAQLVESKTHVLFQSTFVYKTFMARNDVLEYDKNNNCWNLYEIKGTNSLNEHEEKVDHIEDATFQVIILEACGIKIGRVNLIHLNKEYVRGDEINVHELFTIDNITDQVDKRKERTLKDMERAATALFQQDEQALVCQCIYNGRSAHCTTFRHSYPHIPEYSVHDLARIGNSKKKLESLIDSQVFAISDIPEDFELSPIQSNQVLAHRRQIPIINIEGVREEIVSLKFPLYFLDYETYPPAIPLFKGFKPYQQVPFQFSLDVLSDPESEIIHHEYLHQEENDPSLAIISELQRIIGPVGNIIVWHKSFEIGRNNEMAIRNPESRDFFDDVNDRIYDLEDVFKKQHYIHHGFKGRITIKKVLPTLVPELSYDGLEIKEGGAATEAWYQMIYGEGTSEEKQKIANNLKIYCGQDTYAMYAIWKVLWNLTNR